MEIFALALYSCVVLTDLGGDLLSKTCQWQSSGRYYAARELCDAAASAEIGRPVHRFQVTMNAGPETVIKSSCTPVTVITR